MLKNQFPLGATCPRVDEPGSSSLGKILPILSNLILIASLHSKELSKSTHCPQEKKFKLFHDTPQTFTYLVLAYPFNSLSLPTYTLDVSVAGPFHFSEAETKNIRFCVLIGLSYLVLFVFSGLAEVTHSAVFSWWM